MRINQNSFNLIKYTDRESKVKCEASRGGINAAFEKHTQYGCPTIRYASRFAKEAKQNYSINELEFLGVLGLELIKQYI